MHDDRAEEDNRVAADESFTSLSRMDAQAEMTLERELGGLDVQTLRRELLAGVFEDVLSFAKGVVASAAASRTALDLYGKGLRAAQSRCVRDSLQHFPMEPVLKRFMEICFG